MRITILAAGSRGDIQPFLALGVGLQAAGHRVRFAAFRNFAPLIEPYGLEFWPVDADFQAILGGEDGQDMMSSSRNLAQLTRGISRTVGPILARLGDDFWRACQDTDLIFSGLNGVPFFGFEFAQKLGVPCINGCVVPLLGTRAWPNPMWPLQANLGAAYNRLTHAAIAQLGWQIFGKSINAWRSETLGLPAISRAESFAEIDRLPMAIGISPHVIAKPPDWPAWYTMTGYWWLPRPIEWTPPAELVRFIEAGEPPICFSFGSMSDTNSGEMTHTVLEALKRIDRRGILVTAWGGLRSAERSDQVFVIDTVPFDWLWPQCAAVVHHGGAGSTAAGLRAGVPSLVVAFFADQPFWGRRVFELGCGPQPILRKQLTIKRLAAALDRAIHDRVMADRAADIGRKLQSEDGIAHAIASIERTVASHG
jgi:sterol 3beta-glucosyltransferase